MVSSRHADPGVAGIRFPLRLPELVKSKRCHGRPVGYGAERLSREVNREATQESLFQQSIFRALPVRRRADP